MDPISPARAAQGFLKPYPYLSACASIVSHSSWPVAIKSKPDQADFTITNKKGEKIHTGTTPGEAKILGMPLTLSGF
jgi:hypothetical protein